MSEHRGIKTNDVGLTIAEYDAVQALAVRLKAEYMSLYRTSEGLRAFVIDTGGGRHLGVIVNGGQRSGDWR